MLYIGHFSFDEMGQNRSIRHGYFTCVTEAEQVERALDDFKSLIGRMKAEDNNFARIATVYIEDIFEIQHIPETAQMLRIQSSDGPFPESVTRSLPRVAGDGIEVYGWGPDVRKIQASDPNETLEMSPFLSYE